MRVLDFVDGFPSLTAPALVDVIAIAKSFVPFVDDDAYEVAFGAGTEGDSYFNTTTKRVRLFTTDWVDMEVGWTITGTFGVPIDITAVGGIAVVGAQKEIIICQGDGGDINISANPQIAAGTQLGDILKLVFASAQRILLEDEDGISQNGAFQGSTNRQIEYFWTGTLWLENSRKD